MVRGRIERAIKVVAGHLSRLEPTSLLPRDAERLIEVLALGAKVCMAGIVLLAARAGARPERGGDTFDWRLARRLGLNITDARRIIETSKHLDDAPEIKVGLLAGDISHNHASEILSARQAAEARQRRELERQQREEDERRRREAEGTQREDPVGDGEGANASESHTEPGEGCPESGEGGVDAGESPDEVTERLLDRASGGATSREIRDAAARARAAAEDEETRRRRLRETRGWRPINFDDGAVGGQYRLPPEQGERVNSEIAQFLEAFFNQARREGRHEPRDAYGADALEYLILAGASSHYDTNGSPTDPVGAGVAEAEAHDVGVLPFDEESASAAGRGGDCEPDTPVGPDGAGDGLALRFPRRPSQLVVRVDLEALLRGELNVGETCEVPGCGPVPLSTGRALLGEALLDIVIRQRVDIRTVVCGGRRASKALALAVMEHYPYCATCGRRLQLETDHIQPDSLRGPTSYENLQRLCRACHRDKTRRQAPYTHSPQWRADATAAAAGGPP